MIIIVRTRMSTQECRISRIVTTACNGGIMNDILLNQYSQILTNLSTKFSVKILKTKVYECKSILLNPTIAF